jgi:hypothetical protein
MQGKMTTHRLEYHATPTLSLFHLSTAFYRGVLGPVRSGKSTGMCNEIMRRSHEQALAANGKRHTRWVIVRNTYRELEDTTMLTWLRLFPEEVFGDVNRNTMTHTITIGDLHMEVMFRALDRPKDVKKLLSLEVTGAWVNEAKEVPKSIIDTLGDRVGQYPPKELGGCTWRGVMMDTNPPDDDHWWYRLAEEEKPDGWEFWRQPGGLIEANGKFIPNPKAENVSNLNESDYYVVRMAGKKPEYIRVYYCAQYGFTSDGKAVIPEYVDVVHCSTEPLSPVEGVPIRVGIDWGLTPAAIFGQQLPSGRWIWLEELVTEHMGAQRFGGEFARFVNQKFPGFAFETPWGDPAGNSESQADESTPFQMFNTALEKAGVKLVARPAPSNDPSLRHGALSACLSRMIDGKPGLIISPALKTTRKGLAGGYCYKRVQVAGDERYQDKPDKNKYSHPVEAGEYMLIGAGEGRALITAVKSEHTKPLPKPKLGCV